MWMPLDGGADSSGTMLLLLLLSVDGGADTVWYKVAAISVDSWAHF